MRCHRQSLWLFLDNCKVVERRGRVFPKDSMSRFFPLCLSFCLYPPPRPSAGPPAVLRFIPPARRRCRGAAIVDGTEERASGLARVVNVQNLPLLTCSLTPLPSRRNGRRLLRGEKRLRVESGLGCVPFFERMTARNFI